MTEAIGFWNIAEADPHRPAVVDPEGRPTAFGELASLTNRYVHGLRALGLGPGDRVVTVLPNGLDQIALMLATYQCGMYLTPVNWHLVASEIDYIVGDSEARVIVVHERFAPEAAALGESAGPVHRFSVGAVPGYRPLQDLAAGQPDTRPSDLTTGAVMGYTSGTTGRPKGVYRPLHDRHPDESSTRASLLLLLFDVPPHEGNVHLCTAPMYHPAAYLWATMSLHFGHTVVLMDRWGAEHTLRLVEQHRVTQTHVVPTMFHRMLQLPEEVRTGYDVSSLRYVVHAAAPCPVETKWRMLDWWGDCIYEYYAATEGGGTVVSPAQWRHFPGTVGRPWPDTEVIVVDDEGRPQPPGTPGVIYMKMAPQYRFEYLKDRRKTAESYLGDFFTVGDIGYFNDEGYLFLSDRRHDMIIVGGVNIYPAEIEGVMQQCPLVGDVAVFGVPDDDLGETIKAVVEPVQGVAPDDGTREQILAFLAGRLALQRRPHSLDFVETLPRDPNGKLYKRRLRDIYWEGRRRRI